VSERIVLQIYEYLAQHQQETLNWALSQGFNVWHGQGFAPFQQIILSEAHWIDVSPYFFSAPPCIHEKLADILPVLSCQQNELEVYLKTLEKIALNNENRLSVNEIRDTNLSMRLIDVIAERFSQHVDSIRPKLYVPTESRILKMVLVESCYYLNINENDSFQSSRSSNAILHHQLGENVAKTLKIPNLITRVLGGSKPNIFKPWGQKQKLTRNLKTILDDYQDGMAIIKELLQNADDSGATEVSFLYDQRPNENLKSQLFDPGMKDWQGPALWVFNNQMFTETDLENITKLNAGTKHSQRMKIGKFGLGFNSVYHLTDVPSILTGENLVIKYLDW